MVTWKPIGRSVSVANLCRGEGKRASRKPVLGRIRGSRGLTATGATRCRGACPPCTATWGGGSCGRRSRRRVEPVRPRRKRRILLLRDQDPGRENESQSKCQSDNLPHKLPSSPSLARMIDAHAAKFHRFEP